MCGGHHHHHDREQGEHEQRRGRGQGFRGFGRRGFPNREQLVERLQGYQQHLESELQNTRDLLGRLADGGDQLSEI